MILINKTRRAHTVAILTMLSLVVAMLSGTILPRVANASSPNPSPRTSKTWKHDNVASDLKQLLKTKGADAMVKVIVQFEGEISGQLNAFLNSNGVRVKKHFANFNSLAAEFPVNLVQTLSSFPEVAFVSVDSEVHSLGGHVAHTSGADNVRSMSNDSALDGSGVAIAIVDSGIYGAHVAFTDQETGQSRIIVNRDFTGENRTDDPYGHGTHVASAAAGNGTVSQAQYVGIAPRAKLVNL
ncbi:MAG TPA: S8 family serine peptidase, partial [Pyrinomonadaceae bacterium]|nr:S8 family serine peptidase [Pyrinomonadaceae bacterium]